MAAQRPLRLSLPPGSYWSLDAKNPIPPFFAGFRAWGKRRDSSYSTRIFFQFVRIDY